MTEPHLGFAIDETTAKATDEMRVVRRWTFTWVQATAAISTDALVAGAFSLSDVHAWMRGRLEAEVKRAGGEMAEGNGRFQLEERGADGRPHYDRPGLARATYTAMARMPFAAAVCQNRAKTAVTNKKIDRTQAPAAGATRPSGDARRPGQTPHRKKVSDS